MAHKKAAGSKARQGGNIRGKRLGMKVSSGETVKAGSILLRQIGSKIHPGDGVSMGRDFTLFALNSGRVSFKLKQGNKFMSVLPVEEEKVAKRVVARTKEGINNG